MGPNLVLGRGSAVGDTLVAHPDVDAVTFTGSNAVGRAIQLKATEAGAKVQLELGGKNPAVVLADADLELAVEHVARGAFLSAGQKCTATSRVLVEAAVFDEFAQRLSELARAWPVGDPLDERTKVGPLASQAQLETVTGYLELASEESADVLGRAFEFIQTPRKILQSFDWTHNYREVWTNNITLPEDPDSRWYGWAVGKWQGDTLVITSKGYNPKNWLDNFGHPQSENMTMEGRWTRTAYDTLELTMKINDPDYYKGPWVSAKPQVYKLQLPVDRSIIGEEFCVPSEEEAFNENVRNLAGTGKKIVEQPK